MSDLLLGDAELIAAFQGLTHSAQTCRVRVDAELDTDHFVTAAGSALCDAVTAIRRLGEELGRALDTHANLSAELLRRSGEMDAELASRVHSTTEQATRMRELT